MQEKIDKHAKAIESAFLEFLTEFQCPDEKGLPQKFYVQEAVSMKQHQRTIFCVNFRHVIEWTKTNYLHSEMQDNYYKYEPFLKNAIKTFMKQVNKEAKPEELLSGGDEDIGYYNFREPLRDLKTDHIGKLLAITGTVTRTTEVRPELAIGSFRCLACSEENKGIYQNFTYTKPKRCSNQACENLKNWDLVLESSVFNDEQKLKVQENANEIPPGSMPRSIDIIVRNQIVDIAKPGDKCTFVGMLTVVPDVISLLKPGESRQVQKRGETVKKPNQPYIDGVTGLKALGVRELNYKLVFVANELWQTQNLFDMRLKKDDPEEEIDETGETQYQDQFTENELVKFKKIKDSPTAFKDLAECIAPTVEGNIEIKKGILLMLFGGVNKRTSEGIKLRGDINLGIVGDPSTAKSQFLKYVAGFLPRSVYTSGKGTSAAGLTASVQRDAETGEMCIEAGALMLADNGICCIDEFDQMDAKDQSAIHEAMEQQTISIAKAGIHATLNARTSILASASPTEGRENKSKNLRYNVNLSEPIMSRFDLFFVVTDECNAERDRDLAMHIVRLHCETEKTIETAISQEDLKREIQETRRIKPYFTPDAAKALREAYVNLRWNDKTSQNWSFKITVRQLESLVRLSEAIARVHASQQIIKEEVKEAESLIRKSIVKLDREEIEIGGETTIDLESVPKSDIIEREIKQRQEEEKKQEKHKISWEQYNNFRDIVVLIVREKKQKLDPSQAGVKQEDIVTAFVNQYEKDTESVDEIQKIAKFINAIIERMIQQERTLIIMKDDTNIAKRELNLHSNYPVPYEEE